MLSASVQPVASTGLATDESQLPITTVEPAFEGRQESMASPTPSASSSGDVSLTLSMREIAPFGPSHQKPKAAT
jgi:hypothetical protein